MPSYAALLRAINVGGTGKLAMTDLKQIAQDCGLTDVSTYIQSGNLVFKSKLSAARSQKALSEALEQHMQRPVSVFVRSASELRAIEAANPFPDAEPNRVIVFFLDDPLNEEAVRSIKRPGKEELVPGGREVFIYYPEGQGKSKLKLPFDRVGTGRNLNTLRKLIELTEV